MDAVMVAEGYGNIYVTVALIAYLILVKNPHNVCFFVILITEVYIGNKFEVLACVCFILILTEFEPKSITATNFIYNPPSEFSDKKRAKYRPFKTS